LPPRHPAKDGEFDAAFCDKVDSPHCSLVFSHCRFILTKMAEITRFRQVFGQALIGGSIVISIIKYRYHCRFEIESGSG
jgi:hypothetical protein